MSRRKPRCCSVGIACSMHRFSSATTTLGVRGPTRGRSCRRSRGESCQLGTGQRGRRVTGVELPRQRYTACGELPNLNLVGHFQDPGVTKKGHQRVCDQHAGGPGCAENRGGSGAPFVVPCRLSGGIASAGLRHTRSLGVRAMPPRKIYGSEGSDTSLRGVTDT